MRKAGSSEPFPLLPHQRYLYTLDRRRGGLACPAGWRGFCRLGGEGSWYISNLLLYRQSGRAPLGNTTASVTTEATVLSCSCQPLYIGNVLGRGYGQYVLYACVPVFLGQFIYNRCQMGVITAVYVDLIKLVSSES